MSDLTLKRIEEIAAYSGPDAVSARGSSRSVQH
jgi:hypothetical protein